MVTVVSWNIAMRSRAVDEFLAMDFDVALLQEVGPGVLDRLRNAGGNVAVSPQDPRESWPRDDCDRWPIVVKLSDRVEVQWFRQVLPSAPMEQDDEVAASNVGIIAAARVIPLTGQEALPEFFEQSFAPDGLSRREQRGITAQRAVNPCLCRCIDALDAFCGSSGGHGVFLGRQVVSSSIDWTGSV